MGVTTRTVGQAGCKVQVSGATFAGESWDDRTGYEVKNQGRWGPSFQLQICHEYKVNDEDQGPSPTRGKDGCSLVCAMGPGPCGFRTSTNSLGGGSAGAPAALVQNLVLPA